MELLLEMLTDLSGLIVLAIVVVVVAYALGTYLRRRSEARGDLPGPALPQPSRLQPRRLLTGRMAGDRETQAVVGWLLSQAFEQTGVKVADDKIAYQRIFEAAQKAIEELKTQDAVTISLPFLTSDASGPKHFETRLTRAAIQELAKY